MARKSASVKQYPFPKGGGKKAGGNTAAKPGGKNPYATAKAAFKKGAPKGNRGR